MKRYKCPSCGKKLKLKKFKPFVTDTRFLKRKCKCGKFVLIPKRLVNNDAA